MDKKDIRVFDVKVACVFNDKAAAILQQIMFWLRVVRQQAQENVEVRKKHFINGRWWIYKTFNQWQEEFPCWGIATIKREIKALTAAGVIISDCYNAKGYDRTRWYTIDMDRLETLINAHSINLIQCKESKVNDGKFQNDAMESISTSQPIPNNTQRKTTENLYSRKGSRENSTWNSEGINRTNDELLEEWGVSSYEELFGLKS